MPAAADSIIENHFPSLLSSFIEKTRKNKLKKAMEGLKNIIKNQSLPTWAF